MIEPVRTGPVSAVVASAAGRTAETAPQQKVVRIERPSAAPSSSPSLPRLLDLAVHLANSGPPVDYTKVAQVRRAIAEGSYQIDADALAKAILRFAPNE